MSSPWARSQARATCAGVASISRPMGLDLVDERRFRSKFSPVKRGLVLRQSSSADVVDRPDVTGQEAMASGE